jgi:lipopolysaccharide export system protein LptA
MKRSDLYRIWPLGLVLACATLAHGQTAKSPSKAAPSNAQTTAAEAARVLAKTKADRAAAATRIAEAAKSSKRMDAVTQRAKEAGIPKPSFAEQQKDSDTRKRLTDAMSRVGPEGKAILAQSDSSPSLRAPEDTNSPTRPAGTKASPLASDGPGPKPQPLKPTPLTTPDKAPARTIIDAGSSFFDSRAGFGVFVDDVVLNHPEFHLTADELEIYMNKEEKPAEEGGTGADKDKPGAATPTAGGPTAGQLAQDGAATTTPAKGEPAPSERKVGGNIKTAIAKGKKVLITKMSAEGVMQTGLGREAVYDGATGDVVLRGWPQIQKGENLQVATEPGTYFIIKQNGNFESGGGRSQTRIVQESDKKAPLPPPANPAPPTAGPSPAAPASKSRGGAQ